MVAHLYFESAKIERKIGFHTSLNDKNLLHINLFT